MACSFSNRVSVSNTIDALLNRILNSDLENSTLPPDLYHTPDFELDFLGGALVGSCCSIGNNL